MKLIKKTIPGLSHAKGMTMSDNFIVFCTGRKALIYNRNMELMHEFKDLDYVYKAYVSPDEEKLLLVSNGNHFYVASLIDFIISRYVVRGKTILMEGLGCWSFDSKFFYLLPTEDAGNTMFRRYSASDPKSYISIDICNGKYWFIKMMQIKDIDKYLLIGDDREKFFADRDDCWNIVLYDGDRCEEYPVVEMCDEGIWGVDYNSETKRLTIYGMHGTVINCDIYGKNVSHIEFPEKEQLSGSFSDAFKSIDIADDEIYARIKELSNMFGFENMTVDDSINKIVLSNNKKYMYIATRFYLYVINQSDMRIAARKEIEYGVRDILELSDNCIAVAGISNVQVFEIKHADNNEDKWYNTTNKEV